MINMSDFARNMKQLESAFGYRMPDDRLDIYYAKLSKKFSTEQFETAVDNLIMNCTRFPTIADFMEIAKTHRPLL